MFKGILTALVTPLKNETIDIFALGRLIDRQIDAGVQGIVVCATTGEGATLTADERKLVIDFAIKRVQKKIQVIVGTSAIATWMAIDAVKIAHDLGADAMLVAAPSYVKPTQDGLYGHFSTIADQSPIPIIMYNVPSRTSCDIKTSTVARLAGHEKIVAIKEATGSVERSQQIISAVNGKMGVFSGDDPSTLSILVAGGQGVISTGANVVPEKWATLWKHWLNGDIMSAAAVQAGLLGLHEALFLEPNPGPAKAALNLLGLLEPEIRQPLTWATRQIIYRLAAEIENQGLKIIGGSV